MSTLFRATRAAAVSVVVGLFLAAGSPSQAFVVDSVLDEIDDDISDSLCLTAAGTCTLRAAVMQANRMAGDLTIHLPAGTYLLTIPPAATATDASGDLAMWNDDIGPGGAAVHISGAGAATTIIDGNHLDRMFDVDTTRELTVWGVTLRNGLTPNAGGAIQNGGVLEVSYCTISGNQAARGGGISNVLGVATLSQSTVSGNVASAWGGGVYNETTTFHVVQSALLGNRADKGGGAFNDLIGTMFVTNSTISGNESYADGGGIYGNSGGTVWTYNVTIAFNMADADADENGGSGGGVFNGGNFYPRTSIVAGNYHSGIPDLDDCTGTLGIFGQNRFSNTDGCIVVPQNANAAYSLIGSLDELGPLRFNGGSTRTHALLGSSTMVDGGASSADCLNTGLVDQRGISRGADSLCDIGAYEFDALSVDLVFEDGFELGGLWGWGG